MAKHSSVGHVKISELKALPEKYDQKSVILIGSISEILQTGLNPRTFILYDGSGTIRIEYMITISSTTLDYARVGDIVIFNGGFSASQEYVYGGPILHIPRVAFAILGLLAVAYLIRRRK
ncbi:MAG: PGF-CTERM sorting domain-containing protein [Halobacteriota archaeon]|nr:PGF-CTERM sorting domain-containing protein [Halobacteriota archaeon]